ncbi:hypothetical protein GCM10011613_22110 [Cellvibrio zantedeschiae]|uniref:Uncharacterized protein n=1 Tax=Cellvibrio zantedeschiae TaxID=1237077 RepID=A0ABQ3B457_9GAMM|nr:hypothetical protein [Cellvibrio zantedeschiae]GGY77178.1 hypothetical protein GCM10011613_22110 [Cellvibrio zantedeschiae]
MIKQEPTLLLDDDGFDNFLSAQLKQAQPYLSDEDFTAQVMAKLPAAKKLSPWQERLIILVPFLIISLLVISQFSVVAVLVKVWTLLVSADVTSLLTISLMMSVTAVSGASLWFAKQSKLI